MKTNHCLLLFLVFLSAAFLSGEPVRIANVMNVSDSTLSPYNQSIRSGKVFGKNYESAGSSFMAAHFKYFKLAPGDYLEISNGDHSEVFSYTGNGKKDWAGKEMPEFWSRIIRGSSFTVTIYSRQTRQLDRSYRVEIDQISCGYTKDQLQENLQRNETREICGIDDKKWAKCYDPSTMYTKAKAVARLLINASSACTGWLIGPDGYLMTNYHCFSDQASANNTEYEFMGEGETCATDCSAQLSCRGAIESTTAQFIATSGNYDLDYTLVKLPANVTPKYGFMQLRSTLPEIGERIYMPQHAGAKGKALAVTDDQSSTGFAKVDGYYVNDVYYSMDSEGGSSGSPVLSYADHLVVGLHHIGGCPNAAVKIPLLINSLGSKLPPNAIGTSTYIYASFNITTYTDNNNSLFTDTSTSSGCNIASWSWNFGDGSTAGMQNPPLHTYATAGTYTVTLTITSDQNPPQSNSTYQEVKVPQQANKYCPSSSSSSATEWISNVQIGSFSNPSAGSKYSDFTTLTINMANGENQMITLTPGYTGGTYLEYFVVWIDLNHNGLFTDSGEELFSQSGKGAVTGSITIPSGAFPGPTRMRVSMKYNSKPSACETSSTFTYGEVEDYSVNISSAEHRDSLIASFSGYGTWTWNPNTNFWFKINDLEASQMAIGDFDGNGKEDIIGAYSVGLWIRLDNNSWQKVDGVNNPDWLAAGDVNGDGRADVLGVWPGIGVWVRHSDSNIWIRILDKDAIQVDAADFDKDGQAEILGWWDPEGLYVYDTTDKSWTKILDKDNLRQITTGDVDGDKLPEVVGIWTHGVWFYDLTTKSWTRLNDAADKITTGDLNGKNQDDLIGCWTSVPGIWARYSEDGSWFKIHDVKPISFKAGLIE